LGNALDVLAVVLEAIAGTVNGNHRLGSRNLTAELWPRRVIAVASTKKCESSEGKEETGLTEIHHPPPRGKV
jgi:hypothetical protein